MEPRTDPKKKPDAVPPPAAAKPTNGAPAQETPAAAAPPTQAVVKPQKSIRDLIEEAKPKLAEVLPKHLSADRLVRVTVACISRTPMLQTCTRDSLLNSIMQAAQLGLEPTGVLGSAYLVPYNEVVKDDRGKPVLSADGSKQWRKICQLIIGYRGLIDLARRSGQIESIEAHVVHDNDRFSCHYGLEPTLDHEPCWSGDPGGIKAVYAIAKLKDGGKQIEVMTKTQIDKIVGSTQSEGKWGPWKDHYEEMARKTVVRRIAKYLPLTPELADAFALDDAADRIDPDAPDTAPPRGTAGLKEIVAQKAAAATVEAHAEQEPAHDPATGEIHEGDGPPAGPTETIDPSAPTT